MELLINPDKNTWQQLMQRPVSKSKKLEKTVRKILKIIQKKGDKGIRKLTKEFDNVTIKESQVSASEFQLAEKLISPALKEAINQAKRNIETFHLSQLDTVKVIETLPGIQCWRENKGIEKVGLYIPGGSAPLFSSVLMLAIPASIAGCKEIILCTPPVKDGAIHPAILYAASISGVSKVFKIGGVQAIGAMAYGTATVPKVLKIAGPGNQFVTKAKQLVQQDGIAIDMPAGPSEVLIIADETAIPEFVAADLLSQAEHGPDSQVVLLSNTLAVAEKINEKLVEQLITLPRKDIATTALQNSKTIILQKLSDVIDFSNQYAPEHLIIACKDAELIATKVNSAGSVFIGNYSPESAGDYASGTNHTLPTNGYAAMYSGVSVDSFVKKITFQKLSKEGLTAIAATVMEMAEAEGLSAHKNAVAIRLKKIQDGI